MMKGFVGVAGLLLALLLASGTGRAHPPGSPPITEDASFTLEPVDRLNTTYHVYLSGLGIPPDRGDTLHFSWTANAGLGPPISFDIHAHGDPSTEAILYRASAVRVDDSWVVPASDGYMVRWNNSNPESVNVTYRFQLNAPVDLSGLVVIPIITGVIVLLFIVSRRRPRPPARSDDRGAGRRIRSNEDESRVGRSTDSPPPPSR